MLYSLWWLMLGLFLGWVGWFVYDKKFLRDGDDGLRSEPTLTGSSDLADSLAEAETDLQAYSAELARVTDELAETTQAYQRSSEQVGELRKTVARLERELRRGGRPARDDGESDSAEAPNRPAGGRRAAARKAEAAAAASGGGAPLLFPMKPLAGKPDEHPATAEPAAGGDDELGRPDPARDTQSLPSAAQAVAASGQDKRGNDKPAAVPPPLPPPSRLISALQSLSAQADTDTARGETAAPHHPPFGAQR